MLKYIALGIIQGLTEFFPVSSSAHLVIAQRLFGITEGEVAISVVLHLGTVLALIIFFFKDILNALRDKKMLLHIAAVTVITGSIGVLGKDFFENLFSRPKFAAIALIFTGLMLFATKKFMEGRRNLNIKDAVILGFTQAVAIIPGISRSGTTISTLLFRKIERDLAFKFSFLVSIPVILGAALLEAKDINIALNGNYKNLVIGFIFSLLAGLFSLAVLRAILHRAKLHYFGYYCIMIAVLTLVFVK